MIEELFLMIPEHSRLVPRGRKSITIVDAAALPLILPTGAHGLRQRIAPEFENRCLNANVVAEIDSLALLMHRSEEHTSELQSLMRCPYAVFSLPTKKHGT